MQFIVARHHNVSFIPDTGELHGVQRRKNGKEMIRYDRTGKGRERNGKERKGKRHPPPSRLVVGSPIGMGRANSTEFIGSDLHTEVNRSTFTTDHDVTTASGDVVLSSTGTAVELSASVQNNRSGSKSTHCSTNSSQCNSNDLSSLGRQSAQTVKTLGRRAVALY